MKTSGVRWRAIVPIVPLAGVLLGIGAAAAASSGAVSKGCSPVAQGQISESVDFTPYASRRGGQLGEQRINPAGVVFVRSAEDTDLPYAVDGLGLAFVVRASTATYAYYLDAAVDEKTTDEGFLAGGGIEYSVEAADGGGSFAEWLLSNLGERAVPIEVGGYPGALTWADPNAMGTRTHNLYWFDGVKNYSLIGDRASDEIVTVARTLVCG